MSEDVFAQDDAQCPPATQDIALNLKNRKNAIDTAMYGPLNPAEPNDEYWQTLADEWGVDSDTARGQVCGNCAMFNISPRMKDCIESGITDDSDTFDKIDAAGELGYCEAFDFKCASARTCRAWVGGGPITAAAKKRTEAQTPAPKKDRIYGSKTNKPGSAASGKSKAVKFSAKTEEALRNKVEKHNEKASDGRRATLGMLKAVYRRGAGAFSQSHRPGMTRDQWAMGRVNAFLRLLRSGRPSNPNYITDNDLLPAAHPKSTKKRAVTAGAALVPEERDLAEAILEVVAKHGKFDEDGMGVWAGYTPASENKDAEIGVKCANCVFYQGEGVCQIIAFPVEPEGKCRLAVIPEGHVSKKAIEEHVAERKAEDLDELVYASELTVSLPVENEFDSPEKAVLAATEFSGLGYEVLPAFRAAWIRAVEAGEDPYQRVLSMAEYTFDSSDADLLPTAEKGIDQ